MIFDRKNPFLSKIKKRYLLSSGSKETYHLELHSDLPFKVGDSIGVFAQNDPLLVQHLLEALKVSGKESVIDPRSQKQMTAEHFFSFKANLSRLTSPFLKLLHEYEPFHDKKNQLNRLLKEENRALLMQYLSEHDPLDLLKEYAEAKTPLQALCDQFSPLLPRFYSIASSRYTHPHEVHLTVAVSTFTHAGEERFGVASHFLCHLAEEEKTEIPIYVQTAHGFTLPENPQTPIIMIGAGTGIAPYRAFMQERLHTNATRKNWLFFGERHKAHDYLYQDFWEALVAKGLLRLDLAFSRDQTSKLYVQHKMQENAQDLWAWIQEGAHLYVCGDAQNMAKDIESTLHKIASEQGSLSSDEATALLKHLRSQKRYLLDIY